MKISIVLKKACVTLLPMLFFITGFSQIDSTKFKFLPNSQLKILVSPVLYQSLTITSLGENILKSHPVLSFDIGIELYHYINSDYGVQTGLHFGVVPFNMKFDIYIPEYYKTSQSNYFTNDNEFATQFIYFPLSIQKINELPKNKLWISYSAGLSINYIHPYEGSVSFSYFADTSNTIERYVLRLTLENTYQKWFVGYFGKIEIMKIKKNANTFGISLLANYTPKKIGKGTYKFTNIPNPSTGTVELNLNYIGLQLSYGLSLAKRINTNRIDQSELKTLKNLNKPKPIIPSNP